MACTIFWVMRLVAHLLRWCGIALMAAGVLIVVATCRTLVVKRPHDRCQRAQASRGACGLYGCLVTDSARPSRTVCASTRRHGSAGICWLPDCFHRYLTRSHTISHC